MKTTSIIISIVLTITGLYSQEAFTKVAIDNPNAQIDPSPPIHFMGKTGRELGEILLTIDALALGIDGPSGLAWDGTYLYVMSLLNDMCYVVDPTGPSVISSFPTPPTNSYGIGQEQNLWLTCITTDSIYEYTHAGTPTGNGFPSDVTGALYCADGSEWWPDGEIWFVGIGSGCGNQCFKFSVPTGTVLDSMSDPVWTSTSQRGLTYDPWNSKFWVGGWNSDSAWEIDQTGARTGRSFYMDGCAGIAYDWQSTLHPEPVLWITRQAADQIVMVDPDNPGIYNYWDFEDGPQGWTHTNGLAFPQAWAVQASDLNGATWQIPASDDSSMWIDSDAAGSGVWVQDTALSPILVPLSITDWLKYGVAYNHYVYNDYLEVGIKYYDGATWNVAPLVTYTADTLSAQDSIDVSAYNIYELVQFYFYYDDDDSYAWYAAFDNVSVTALVAMHDVAAITITSPPAGFAAPGNYDVIAWIRNYGNFTEDFTATANVYDTTNAWNLVYTQTNTITGLPQDGDTVMNLGSLSLGEGLFYTEVFTELLDDQRPYNDTTSVYTATLETFDLVWDFETGWQSWTHTNGLTFPSAWAVITSAYKPTWTVPEAGDSSFWIDSDAAGVLVQDTALSPVIYPDSTTLYLKLGLGYNWYSSGEWLEIGIKYYDAGSATAVPLITYTQDAGPMWELLDISGYYAYDSIQIYLYYDANYCWYVTFDNVAINGDTIPTGQNEEPGEIKPLVFGFAPNAATMCKGNIPIGYTTTVPGHVSLKVYDATGRLVQTQVDEHQSAGEKSAIWNGMDINNRRVANGVYLLKLEAEGKTDTYKIIFVR